MIIIVLNLMDDLNKNHNKYDNLPITFADELMNVIIL